MNNKPITQQLLEIPIGSSLMFTKSKYGYLNFLISSRHNKDGVYFSLTSEGDNVRVTRLKQMNQQDRRGQLLGMNVGETYIQEGSNYRSLFHAVRTLEQETGFEWHTKKDGDLVFIKRLK